MTTVHLEARPQTFSRTRAVMRGVGHSLLSGLSAFIIVIALWQIVILRIPRFFAKGPVDVFSYLFITEAGADASQTAAAHRAILWTLLGATLRDAAFGFVAGMLIAIILALVFSLSATVRAAVMPLALLLRTVPLVAIAPVIILITGLGTTSSVAVIGSIVVLFPALAAIMFGLNQASPQSLDLVRVYGGSTWTALRKVKVPAALPSILSAARVSVPGAMTGALLAEWLSTGEGIGGMITKFSASARYDDLWASVATITIVTLILYNLVQLVENVVLARMGMRETLR